MRRPFLEPIGQPWHRSYGDAWEEPIQAKPWPPGKRKPLLTEAELIELREWLARYNEWMAADFDLWWDERVASDPCLVAAPRPRNPFRR